MCGEKCGSEIDGGEEACGGCGASVGRNESGESARLGDNAGIRMLLPVGRSPWAIAAGYLGIFSVLVVPAPLALIISIVAIIDIFKSRKSPSPKHGLVRAVFGLVMGLVFSLLLAIVAISMIFA